MWYKAWLETRMTFALILLVSIALAAAYISDGPESPEQWRHRMMNPMFLVYTGIAVALSGSGMTFLSEARLKPTKSPAMQYTLSLPVRRRSLLSIRAVLGGSQAAAAVILSCALLWAFAPTLREAQPIGPFSLYVTALIAGNTVVFAIGLLAGTFLGEIWRFYTTAIVFAGFMAARVQSMKLPAHNLWRKAAYLLVPVAADYVWLSMLTSVVLAVLVWYAAVRAFERMDF